MNVERESPWKIPFTEEEQKLAPVALVCQRLIATNVFKPGLKSVRKIAIGLLQHHGC